MGEVLSELVRRVNRGQVSSLLRAGYMSPQNSSFDAHGFSCLSCDFHRESRKMEEVGEDGRVAYCVNPKVAAYVEKAGCCCLFEIDGVHSP